MSIEIKGNKLSRKNSYRPEIDGLRAFAVVAVIVNHFNKEILPNGYLGVDIFFVISGFVITSSLYKRPSKNFKNFISGFYQRRIKRLVPALAVFILIMSVLICLFNPLPSLSLRTGLSSLFGLSNLYLLKQSTDYFAPSTELNVFTHTWSLGVEEQFYIIFPFLIWLSGFGRRTKNGERNLCLTIGILAILSLLGFLYLYPINHPAAYFLMPTRFWEIASGCLLFIEFQKRKSIERFFKNIPPIAVIALIIGVMYLPMPWAQASTIAVCVLTLIFFVSIKKHTRVFTIFTHPKVVFIGQISYSLYLWHWGILSISRWTIGIHWWSVPFQIALIFVASVTSYKYVETPVRKGKWFGEKLKTLILGSGVLFTLSGGVFALEKSLKEKIYLGKESKCIPYQDETCSSADRPHISVTPFIKETKIQRKECIKYRGPITNKVMNLCKVAPKDKTLPTIFIAGSSYSHHLSPVFEKLRKEFGIGISMMTTSSCDLDPLLLYESSKLTCRDSNKNRILHIKNNATEGDILFIGVTQSRNFLEDSVKKIIEIAQNKNINVIHYTPIPEWLRLTPGVDDICKNGPEIQWYRPKGTINCSAYSEISWKIYKKTSKNNEVIDSLNMIEQTYSNFHVFPIHEYLCDSSKCPSHIKGIRLYSDNTGHISIYAAKKYLYSEIKSFLIERKLIKNKISKTNSIETSF